MLRDASTRKNEQMIMPPTKLTMLPTKLVNES